MNEFKKFYEEEGKLIRSDETHPDVAVRYKRMILPLLPKVDKILDVGCGDGYLVSQLRKKGYTAFGVDISKNRINYAKKKYGNFYTVGSAYNIKLKDSEFDLVIASEIIEHLDNPDKAIKELKRISKKYMIITVPYKEKLIREVCPHCTKKFYRSGHIHYFDWARIEKTMQNNGLKILGIRKVAYYPFINFPLPVAIFANWILAVMDKTTYIAVLCEKFKD